MQRKCVFPWQALLGLCLLLLLGNAYAADQWGRAYFPNYELTNQDGQKLLFYDDVIKDKVVAINFMFTSCSDVCPVETAKMRAVQRKLGDRVGRDVFMYSITVDPDRDTPEVLKAYSEKFQVGPGWQFLTGKKSDIDQLQKRLGLYIQDIQETDPLDHNVSLVLGNETTGRWLKRTPYESAEALEELLGYALHGNLRKPGTVNYARAGQLANFDRGQYLFRTRCASCHTIGGGHEIGPDLINVTATRERAWLRRWIKEPDVMLAEGDPLAVQLTKQFNDVAMPNLSLNDIDVDALLLFFDKQRT